MLTKTDLKNGICSPDEFWQQLVDDGVLSYIGKLFTKKYLQASDGLFQEIPHRYWESLSVHAFCCTKTMKAMELSTYTDAADPVARLAAKQLYLWWQQNPNTKIYTKDTYGIKETSSC